MSLEKKFIEKGWFAFVGPIKDELLGNFEKYIKTCEGTLKLFIRTTGGSSLTALWMVDLMNLWKKIEGGNIYSFCIQECNSAGLIILSACDKEYRECALHTRFLFHDCTITPQFSNIRGLEEAKIALEKKWWESEKSIEQQMKGFGLSKEKILELREFGEYQEYSLTSSEAKDLGIIANICEASSNL